MLQLILFTHFLKVIIVLFSIIKFSNFQIFLIRLIIMAQDRSLKDKTGC